MKKTTFNFLLEFRKAKFMNLDIIVPLINFNVEYEHIPKREDEYYER